MTSIFDPGGEVGDSYVSYECVYLSLECFKYIGQKIGLI